MLINLNISAMLAWILTSIDRLDAFLFLSISFFLIGLLINHIREILKDLDTKNNTL